MGTDKHLYLLLHTCAPIGRRDFIHVDVRSAIQVVSMSADPRYDAVQGTAWVTNRDIYWPVVTEVRPAVSPLLGRTVSLAGRTIRCGRVFVGADREPFASCACARLRLFREKWVLAPPLPLLLCGSLMLAAGLAPECVRGHRR